MIKDNPKNDKEEKKETDKDGGGLLDKGKTPSKKEKLEKAIEEGKEKKPSQKRTRRTKSELFDRQLREEKALLRDDNYEVLSEVLKMLSDYDADKFGISKVDKEIFDPMAKNYAIICNYFFPTRKAIYFVIASASFQTFATLRARKEKIDAANPEKAKNEKSNIKDADTGKVGVGQESLSEVPITKI